MVSIELFFFILTIYFYRKARGDEKIGQST
ncbi:hypothetical protein BTGOE4_49270 [Bacillus thuringiensis]|uniref:Uncharacterized protein n=1 Tax=Bacillus thuringiensis TaxID=1428 RepID=A0A9X5N248_BACTU|nr:hypothetical protein BTGOE4_49270 [Bacillus thuringiensis]